MSVARPKCAWCHRRHNVGVACPVKDRETQPKKPKAPKGRLEREVQAGIIAYLSLRKDLWFWRQNTQAGIAPSGRFMRSGKTGAADIQGVLAPHGKFFAVEVKREKGGVVSPDQLSWCANVVLQGGIYVVARSVADVEKALPVWRKL